jgi:PAS domain S-box-containing protein
VAGTRRDGFPTQADRLCLTVASGQATLAFREVRQLSDRPLPRDTSLRQSTVEALAESERKIKLFFDTIPVTAWCTTADGMAEFFNQHHLDYVGRTSEELVGLGYLSQFHPDDLPRLLRTWQGMLASKCGGELEGRVRRADGEYRWTLMRTNPLLDQAGNVIRWYGVNTDIEDRKRAEDSLRAAEKALTVSEHNLSLIIDSLPVLVWASRADGSADFVNNRYLDYVGLQANEVLDWGYLNVFHPEDRGPILDRWKAQLSADTAAVIVRMRRFDHVYRWFYLSGQKFTDATGNIRWFGVAIDVEDLKRVQDALRASEAALQESERRLRQIIGTIPGLVWAADADGAVTFINQHFLDYTGLTVEKALGNGWIAAVHTEDAQNLILAWQSMRDAGKGGDIEARLRRADGQYRWFLFRTNPLYDDAGTLTQWFGVNTDIEDRKRVEENLRESQAELAHMTRMMTNW